MDRKSLLIQAEATRPVMPTDPKKLEEEATEGMALKNMIEGRGWKYLLQKFIEPRRQVSRILQEKTQISRNEACGAVDELNKLIDFINRHIADGHIALEQIEAAKKGRS